MALRRDASPAAPVDARLPRTTHPRFALLGAQRLQRLEQLANERGADAVILNAREPVVGFYERNGYRIVGPGHTLYQTIRHLRMIKHL